MITSIENLSKVIGGKIGKVFNYSIDKNYSYKVLLLELEEITKEKLEIILQNNFVAALIIYNNLELNQQKIVVHVRQEDEMNLEYIIE